MFCLKLLDLSGTAEHLTPLGPYLTPHSCNLNKEFMFLESHVILPRKEDDKAYVVILNDECLSDNIVCQSFTGK